MRRTLAPLLPLLCAAAVAGGCAEARSGPPPLPSQTPSPSASSGASPLTAPPPSTPAPSATHPPGAAIPLVTYGRQGGIAGVDDRLTVRSDGSYEASRRGAGPRRGTLPPATVAGLTSRLEAANFADIPAVNSAGGVVADGFTYYVTYDGHAVLAQDTAVPDALRPVLSALDEVLDDVT